jgi:hypothetical protein
MLGRRAALAGTMLVLAVSGGTALAATHGSSHSTTKPKVHKVIRPATVAPAVVRTGHHCHESGTGIASSL